MSTHFPPSQPDGAPHGSSETAPAVPYESSRTAGPHPTNPPISRGERRGWNTATGIIGGLGALSLLVGGAGAATAAVMTQERTDTWTASSEASRIVVDSNSANVRVLTSPTVENVEVTWQVFGWGLGDQPAPQESDGEWLWLPAAAEGLYNVLIDQNFILEIGVSSINTDPWDFILTPGD